MRQVDGPNPVMGIINGQLAAAATSQEVIKTHVTHLEEESEEDDEARFSSDHAKFTFLYYTI